MRLCSELDGWDNRHRHLRIAASPAAHCYFSRRWSLWVYGNAFLSLTGVSPIIASRAGCWNGISARQRWRMCYVSRAPDFHAPIPTRRIISVGPSMQRLRACSAAFLFLSRPSGETDQKDDAIN